MKLPSGEKVSPVITVRCCLKERRRHEKEEKKKNPTQTNLQKAVAILSATR